MLLTALLIVAGAALVAGAVSVTWAMTCTIVETITGNLPSLSTPDLTKSVTHSVFNQSGILDAGSAVPATKQSSFILTLTAGAATIDLTALAGLNGAVVDGTGLKVQLLRITNLGANAMTFAEGVANGYAIGSSIVVRPGGSEMLFGNDSLPDVAAGDRLIDVAGTAAQTASITVVMG